MDSLELGAGRLARPQHAPGGRRERAKTLERVVYADEATGLERVVGPVDVRSEPRVPDEAGARRDAHVFRARSRVRKLNA